MLIPMILRSRFKEEIRAHKEEGVFETPEGFEVRCPIQGVSQVFLPPGIDKLEDLPRFEDTDDGTQACHDYVRGEWPQLQS